MELASSSKYGAADTVTALLLKLRRRDDVSLDEEDVIVDLVGAAQPVRAKRDIVRDGDRPIVSTLIVHGFAGRYKILANGARQITAVHVPGDFVDFHSFLLKDMDHGVTALTDCMVVKAPHASLKVVSETRPHLTRLFSLSSLIDSAIHREWVVCLGRRRATEHLAHLICEIYQLLETVRLAVNFQFEFPITQTDLADMLGLSAVHTNRTVQELRRGGLISWESHKVKIHDWTRLCEFGDFDSRYLHLTREAR